VTSNRDLFPEKGRSPVDGPHILLVNPWIHDFAAYDVWAKPLGLLQLAGILRAHGARVSYLDCLDRFHPRAPASDPHARDGRGPYRKTPIPPPAALRDVRRTYSRYGIDPDWFLADLRALSPPDLILVTSLMTYWYPGVEETIRHIRAIFPDPPLVLGGIYATLCPDHARRHAGADFVAEGAGEGDLLGIVSRWTGWQPRARFDPERLDTYPYPALDLMRAMSCIPLLSSRGCPFDCAYCASKVLVKGYRTRTPAAVATEIAHWHRHFGAVNVAFYDDALLLAPETHAIPLLEAIIDLGLPLAFHTPNALHVRGITPETAKLMHRAGFKTIRLGLETLREGASGGLDAKTNADEFRQAAAWLREAGFTRQQVGAYLLVGLPDQDPTEVEAAISMVRETQVTPILAHYTPIPHTRLWAKALAASRYDLAADPVLTNNAVSPCQKTPFSWESLTRLKKEASEKPLRSL
jgi:radical SAM superfamily enzyme YgiQ (UPF0313 family)